MDIQQSLSQDDVSLSFPTRKGDNEDLVEIGTNDSLLSSDDDEDDELGMSPAPSSSLVDDTVYMEHASMEASTTTDQPNLTKIQASGRLGRRLSSRSECILVDSADSFTIIDPTDSFLRLSSTRSDDSHTRMMLRSEQDVFAAVGEDHGGAIPQHSSSFMERVMEESSSTTTGSSSNNNKTTPRISNSKTMESNTTTTTTISPSKSSPRKQNNHNAWSILRQHGILKKKDAAPWKLVKSNSEALHALFEAFCDPPMSMETCRAILLLEEKQLYNEQNNNIPLPDPLPMICLHEKSRLVSLLLNPTCLQELSVPFVSAVLRLLVRLLSNETDLEYSVAVGTVSSTQLPLKTPSSESTTASQQHNNNDAYYQVVRFQCAWMQHCNATNAVADKLAVETVLELRDDKQLSPLLTKPFGHFVQVCAAAGVTPRILRRLRYHVQPTRPPRVAHAFCFAGRPLQRTLTGLSHWPFRNDFGFAIWFRAERLVAPIQLLSVQGHAIHLHISLLPVAQGGACTVAVTAGEATVHEQGFCVLPRVWYHLAVRHTRSRLKGVFKLSTREQLSILLNAKTMVTTENLPFPVVDEEKGSTNITITLGDKFEGQTGALYLFDDNVSDASLRALYELSARSTVQRVVAADNSWDARRGDLVRKSRVLDAAITKDDADEIVLSHRRPRRGAAKTISHVMDLLDVEETDDLPQELSRSAFGSKVFLSWDPRRTIGKLALELHIGAHVSLDGVCAWSFQGAQDVISSVGGVQALIPLFRSQLLGNWSNNSFAICTVIPNLLKILSSFVRDHNDNARELLRCGGIDVFEQLLHSSKKLAVGKSYDTTVFGTLNSHPRLVSQLVEALFELRAACSHYVGLETKIYSRLLFNVPLWLGGFSNIPGASLHTVLLPVLARLSNENPQKVRDCVGAVEMVQAVKAYSLDLPHLPEENRFLKEPLGFSPAHLTCQEREQGASILLGIIFNVLASGTSPRDFSAFLHLLAFALDDGTRSGEKTPPSTKTLRERKKLAVNVGMMLMLLLQLQPAVQGLFESFAHTCGGVQNSASWILSSLVDSKDDEIRSIGIRCLASYLGATSKGPDSHLSVLSGQNSGVVDLESTKDLSARRTVRRNRSRFSTLAQGIVTMGPSVRNIIVHPSNLTTRVVMKLLWHLLKSHRSRLGPLTHAALLDWITDDEGSVSASLASRSYVTQHMVRSLGGHTTFCFDHDWIVSKLVDTGSLAAKVLRNPLAISTVLKLLRFMEMDQKDQWLNNILELSKSNRKCVALLAGLPEWQHSLFSFLSETLEQVSARRRKEVSHDSEQSFSSDREPTDAESASRQEPPTNLHRRLDLALNLYSVLLGHLLRCGGDHALEAVEKTAALERVFVNGHDVLLLILSGFCRNIAIEGTILEIGALSAQDWQDVDLEAILLKQSAKLITDAILSNGTKGLEMATAVRSWRGLRHLLEVIVVVTAKCRLSVVDLFGYPVLNGTIVDSVSGGLGGIRLPDDCSTNVTAEEYIKYLPDLSGFDVREIDRRLCCRLGDQIFSLLDAFLFPQSLNSSSTSSPLDGLALVRFNEARLGTSQGPLISSTIRLSFLLLTLVEPCSLTFLQCCSRLRCLLCWALELFRESSIPEVQTIRFHPEGGLHIDRLVVAVVLHCHRALGRCARVVLELETNSSTHQFQSKDAQKKYHRRLLRATLELRDVVSTALDGRGELLASTLSADAFEGLRTSLEAMEPRKNLSKEEIAHAFLVSKWVSGFQGTFTRNGLTIPDQVSTQAIPKKKHRESDSLRDGVLVVERLSKESSAIVSDFDSVINSCFEDYLEQQRKWAETDAVRDLEYDGDMTWRRLYEKHQVDAAEAVKAAHMKRAGADARWRVIHGKAVVPWKNENYWMLAKNTDQLGRRTLLVQNSHFKNHHDACYDTSKGRDFKQIETDSNSSSLKKGLSDVMRRNADAFVMNESMGEVGDDDSFSLPVVSDGDSTDQESATTTDADSIDGVQQVIENLPDEEEWDKIDSEEIKSIDANGGSDLWASAFIWAESETVVARFEPVVIVSLQTYVEGKVLLTTHNLYFRQLGDEISVMTKQPVEGGETGKDRRWRLTRLTEVHGRRYMLRPQALELFFSDSHELLLNFPGGFRERDRFHAKLRNSCRVPMLWSPKSLNPRVVFRKSKLTELWRKRKISNFYYLMALNRMAGRSFNDLTQYPVFPWVIADYTSQTIDLSDSRVYRDLSKPVGALNPDRLAQLLERYNDLELFGFPEEEKFLYGSHYSSPGVVLHFLIRQEPFTTMAIDLQSGRFDCPDRLFCDIAGSWNGCLTSSADMKELIPELFSLPEMFLNTNKFPLGITQSGKVVDNVKLPPWAKGSAYEFVRIHRLALESDYVSQNLHHWIDLIFGFKQRGPAAEEAHNIFHHLSYEGSVDLDKIADEIDRNAAESHIQNFGQTPSQLKLEEPHPSRLSEEQCWVPLIGEASSARSLRCYTPSKQFANKRSEFARGPVLKLHVFSDSILAVYADLSMGSYKWTPSSKTNRLRMDKLRPFSRRELSVSRTAMKRGSAVSTEEVERSSLSVGNWSFGVTLGGQVKEELRRNTILSSGRLISASEVSLATAESSALIVSCGYWDDTLKLHNSEGTKVLASETGGHRGPIRCLALGEDGALMVTGGQDCTCRVWVLDHPDMSIALSDGYVQTALGASYDGEQLLSCCHVLWGHESPITTISLDSKIDAVVSGGENGLVCVHTLRRGEFIRSFRPPPLPVSNLAGIVSKLVLGTEGNIVVHMQDKGLHTYTINGVRLCSVDAGENINEMQMCSFDQVLVTGGDRCQVLVRNVADLKVCAMLDLSRHGPIQCLAITPSELNPINQFLFVGSDDGMITVIDGNPLGNRDDSGKNTSSWTDQHKF